jgi:hypothetical protein
VAVARVELPLVASLMVEAVDHRIDWVAVAAVLLRAHPMERATVAELEDRPTVWQLGNLLIHPLAQVAQAIPTVSCFASAAARRVGLC